MPEFRLSSHLIAIALGACLFVNPQSFAAGKKVHTIGLGVVKKVAYGRAADPAGALASEDSLKVRPLIVDGAVKEWTTGDFHEVTDRSFLVRRALRLNDTLPGDKPGAAQNHWVWQRGPWLLVDRTAGHVTALKLPDYDPGVSQVSWFRDYGAYCGLSASGKALFAVVAQLSARKPALAKKLAAFEPGGDAPVCAQAEWQRDPLRVTFHPAGKDAITFELTPGSALLVEDSAEEPEKQP